MTRYFVVGLGGNLGSREAYLRAAEALVASEPGWRVTARSGLYRSAAVGPPQPDFLNAALRVETDDAPHDVLDRLLAIEAALGRVRRVRWGPRTIDLDLLAWSGGAVRSERLTVPHAELAGRPFARQPLADVAPELDVDAPALAPPTRLAWTEPSWTGDDRLEVRALDDLDAWALAASAWRGDPGPIEAVVPFAIPSAGVLEEALDEALAGARAVLDRLDEAGATGRWLIGARGPRRADRATVVTERGVSRVTAAKLL